MPDQPVLQLVDRLRGRYVLAVNDGAGLLDGSDVFVRQFDTEPLHHEAASVLERLERGEELDTDDLILRLSEPQDPYRTGKTYVLPIYAETIREIARLQLRQGRE